MPDEERYRRIAVLGCSGAGKSTLAVLLGDATGLPVVHLDKEHWLPGWTEPDRAAWSARLLEIAARPEWIVDGQYGTSLTERLRRADLAIFLDLPTAVCLWRIVKRWWHFRGRVRPEMGEGCPEKIDFEFFHYVATFRWRQRPKIIAAIAASGVQTVRLHSRRDQDAFVAALTAGGLDAAITAAFRAPS